MIFGASTSIEDLKYYSKSGWEREMREGAKAELEKRLKHEVREWN